MFLLKRRCLLGLLWRTAGGGLGSGIKRDFLLPRDPQSQPTGMPGDKVLTRRKPVAPEVVRAGTGREGALPAF